MGWDSYDRFPPYVSVAERKERAARKAAELKKKGHVLQPVVLQSKKISTTFWGKAWCEHLESYSDYDNRLPRGRTYVRNGSVFDLKIAQGEIKALVSGSSIYNVTITIAPVAKAKWQLIVQECSGKINSFIELLQGKFSNGVMEIITHRNNGLFPSPKEIKLNCSCPDSATMCKHIAAALYGIGARLDERPEELFLLRQVDHTELFANVNVAALSSTPQDESQILADADLSALFGIEIESSHQANSKPKKSAKKQTLPVKTKKALPKSKSKSKPIPKKASTAKKATAVKSSSKKSAKPVLKKPKKIVKKKVIIKAKK